MIRQSRVTSTYLSCPILIVSSVQKMDGISLMPGARR
jgi:hypothetical protein